MEEIITKKELNELMKIKGELMGLTLRNAADYIIKEEGEEGLKKIEKEMAKLGYPIDYKKIKTMKPFPINLYNISLVLMKKIFGWDDKKFKEMGIFQFKTPLTVRLFMRFLVSIDKITEAAQMSWKRYYMVGDLKVKKVDTRKRYIIIRIENFYPHYLHCQTFLGVISTIAQMVVRKAVACEETKCTYKGDEYHEFLIKW